MSRTDYPAGARTALDRLDVPPLSAQFADRVVAAAIASGNAVPPLGTRVPPRRDRRGLWRRAGQAAIGVAAFGMMSAAAVASGLLGAVGIEVPVLTAMLAPEPAKKAKPVSVKKPPVQQAARAVPPPPVAETIMPPPAIEPALPPWRQAVLARQEARRAAFRAERAAFLDRHPGLREAIAAGPEARKAYLAQHPEVRAEVRDRIADARARAAAKRAAVNERRLAQMRDPATRAAMVERRQARIDEFMALDPEARAARIEAFRAKQAARRAMRADRRRAQEIETPPMPTEGSATDAR